MIFLGGCWDQKLLKDTQLIMTVGFDLVNNENVKVFVTIPTITPQGKEKLQITSAVGNTPRECIMKINRKISENTTITENRIVVFTEKAASENIYPFLDAMYREPVTAINARVAIVEDKLSDFIQLSSRQQEFPSEFLNKLVLAAEENSQVEKATLQSICSSMNDKGKDFILPILNEINSEIQVKGSALFHGKVMTGKLDIEEGTMYLILNNKIGKNARLNEKISRGHEKLSDYVTINVENVKRKMHIIENKDGQIEVDIDLKLNIEVEEYPKDHLFAEKEIQKLNNILSKKLTDLAYQTLKKLQEANCDALGIKRRLMAFKYDVDETTYKNIKFKTNISVNIVNHGIIN